MKSQPRASATRGARQTARSGRRRRALVLVLAAGLLVWGPTPSPATAAPPLWRVLGRGGEVDLFGSVHLLSPNLAWRTPELEAAIRSATSVWFEIPFDAADQRLASEIALSRGRLPPGQGLLRLLAPKEKSRLLEIGLREGLPADTLDRYRPWLADLMLSVLSYEADGAQASSGVEEQISKDLPGTVRRGAFETAEQQIGLFADVPQKDQLRSLKETVDELSTDPGAFQRLEDAWLAGDLARIDAEAVQPLRRSSPGAWRRLVFDRNRRWADQIVKLLDGGGRTLVVVGAGHLVGAGGVPALLRARGIEVEGP